MGYTKIIKDVGKYHYILSTSNKTLYLSCSNSKNEARKEALEELEPIMDKVQGKIIYLLTLRKIPKKDLEKEKDVKIKLLGGPIEGMIEKIEVVNKKKLKNLGGFKNNRFYFTSDYLEKKDITKDILEKMVFEYKNETGHFKNKGPLDVVKV